MFDALTILLESLKVQSASLCDFRFVAPWGFEIDYPIAHSFTVVEGRCWYDFGNGTSGFLEVGDSMLAAQGGHYVLSHERALPTRRLNDLWLGNGLYRFNGDASAPSPLHIETAGEGPQTRLFSFAFAMSGRSRHPLISSLPAPLIVRRQDNIPWPFVAPTLQFIADETGSGQMGYAESARQLAELFVTQWVRGAVRRQTGGAGEGLKGLEDPLMARALQALHQQPEADWSVDRLARLVGLSRSAFAERFVERVGLPPMRYLSRWRAQRAAELLGQHRSVAEVALLLGYGSERTFREAFKRETGRTPSSNQARLRRASAATDGPPEAFRPIE